jgi:hypothetical protein
MPSNEEPNEAATRRTNLPFSPDVGLRVLARIIARSIIGTPKDLNRENDYRHRPPHKNVDSR